DNDDVLLFASGPSPYAWVNGIMDFNPANTSNWDVEVNIKRSPLWPYCGGNAALWRCPGDRSWVLVSKQRMPRVRSMSMSFYFGGFAGNDAGLATGWRMYFKFSDLIDPGPTRTWLFLDMREDSIDAGNFLTGMVGWPDNPYNLSFY